jgi:hypothetical protein
MVYIKITAAYHFAPNNVGRTLCVLADDGLCLKQVRSIYKMFTVATHSVTPTPQTLLRLTILHPTSDVFYRRIVQFCCALRHCVGTAFVFDRSQKFAVIRTRTRACKTA